MPSFLALLAVSCSPVRTPAGPGDSGDSGLGATQSVLEPEGWAPATGATPFGAPPEACPATAYGVEYGFFEVETDLCAFAVFTQPLPAAVAAGTPVEFVSWHLDLWALEATTATVVLQIGEERIYEDSFAVPGPEDVASISATVAGDHPAGTPAWWHVSNHGYNSYRLGDVELGHAR